MDQLGLEQWPVPPQLGPAQAELPGLCCEWLMLSHIYLLPQEQLISTSD